MPPLWKAPRVRAKYPMQILAPVSRMPDIAALTERFPELTVVIDHMADCPVDKPRRNWKSCSRWSAIRRCSSRSRTPGRSRSQAYPYRDAQEQVKRLYHAFGPKRLMWGTDWPIVEASCKLLQALTVVRDEMKFLNEDDLSWILSKTVERVWPFS